jgi:hypothetical protein
MKRIKIMGLCLVAVFAFAAMAAASASASLHLYLECAKAPKNSAAPTYSSKECTLASEVGAGGKYLLKTPAGKGAEFKTKSSESKFYAFIPANEEKPLAGGAVVGEVVCEKSKGDGEIKNVTLATWTITFEKCTSEGEKCESGSEDGEIETSLLSTTPVLGYNPETKEPTKESLLWTYPAAALLATQEQTARMAEELPFAVFKCGERHAVVYGSVLGLLTAPPLEQTEKAAIDKIDVNDSFGQNHVFFFGDEPDQVFLFSLLIPPTVFLPSSLDTTQAITGGDIGIYPPEGFAAEHD